MRLPGGLWQGGRRQREVAFRPLTGAVELAVGEALQAADSLPEATTSVLYAALDHIGGRAPDAAMVDALCVGDRQFLTLCLAGRLGGDDAWFTVDCEVCGERFDFPVRFSALPVKPAGTSYPFCDTVFDAVTLRWRVPNGADQKILAGLSSEEAAIPILLRRCLVPDAAESDAAGAVDGLTAAQIARIEAAMEAQAPEVTRQVQATCTGCARVNRIDIEPLLHLTRPLREVEMDIHRLASTYHWSEAEILSLPRQRRLRYLDLIDRARGVTG